MNTIYRKKLKELDIAQRVVAKLAKRDQAEISRFLSDADSVSPACRQDIELAFSRLEYLVSLVRQLPEGLTLDFEHPHKIRKLLKLIENPIEMRKTYLALHEQVIGPEDLVLVGEHS